MGRQMGSFASLDQDMEANMTPPHASTINLIKLAGPQDGASGSEDDLFPRGNRFFKSRRCRQAWASNKVQLLVAFFAGMLLTYAAFSISLPTHKLKLPRAQNATDQANGTRCARKNGANLPFGFSPLALQTLTRDQSAIPEKLIVAARHHEDTSWLDTYLSEIPHVVYQVDDPKDTKGAQHATIANKGNEAMAYLQFIIDYYDQLPPVMVFLHGHRSSWHMLDVVPVLQRLKWDSHGFAPLRYRNSPGDRLDWKCGARTDDPIWKNFDCDWEGANLRPGNFSLRDSKDVNEVNKDLWVDSLEMQQVWGQAFEDELGALPSEMQSPCCSTFLVTKERILRHRKAFYVHLRDWIIRTEMNSYRAGRMLEYTWHMIFGEQPVLKAIPECSLLRCD